MVKNELAAEKNARFLAEFSAKEAKEALGAFQVANAAS